MLAILFIADVEGCASNETIQFPSVTWWKAKLNQQIMRDMPLFLKTMKKITQGKINNTLSWLYFTF